MNREYYDDNSDLDNNSPRGSEFQNTEPGERRSFHTAYSPEDTEDNEKAFETQDKSYSQSPVESNILDQNPLASNEKNPPSIKQTEQYKSSLMMSTPDEFMSFQNNGGWSYNKGENAVEDKPKTVSSEFLRKDQKLGSIDLVQSLQYAPIQQKEKNDHISSFGEAKGHENGDSREQIRGKKAREFRIEEKNYEEDENRDRGIDIKEKQSSLKRVNEEEKEEDDIRSSSQKESPLKKVEVAKKVTQSSGTGTGNSLTDISTEKVSKASKEIYENFADEDILYPTKKDIMRISKTIETQTNDIEFPSSYVTGLPSDRVEINIPETKVIRDGLIYTYLVYKLVTKLKDDEDRQNEFTVYRRYSDFDWLFENLASKYYGYVIPIPPPKNILTAINKEGLEFAETRKKELVTFLRKCMQHQFLKNTPELNMFLSDDKGFHEFKKKEQNLQQNKKDYSLLTNVSKIINSATKGTSLPLREVNDSENELYNSEVAFVNLKRRLQLFSGSVADYLQLKRKQTATLISFTHELECILVDSRLSSLENEFKKITRTDISNIENDLIKDLTDKIEVQLKDIIINIEAVTSSIDRRNGLVKELSNMHGEIEEKNLKFKKESTNGDELDELRKDYDRLKKRCQEASDILLKELKTYKQKVDCDLNIFIEGLSKRKETYFSDVYGLWSKTSL